MLTFSTANRNVGIAGTARNSSGVAGMARARGAAAAKGVGPLAAGGKVTAAKSGCFSEGSCVTCYSHGRLEFKSCTPGSS